MPFEEDSFTPEDSFQEEPSVFVDRAKVYGKGLAKGVETMPIAAGGLIQEAGERAEEAPSTFDTMLGMARGNLPLGKTIRSEIFKRTDIDEKIAEYGKSLIKKTQSKIALKYPQQKDKVNRVLEDLGSGTTSLATSLAIGLGTKNPAYSAIVYIV